MSVASALPGLEAASCPGAGRVGDCQDGSSVPRLLAPSVDVGGCRVLTGASSWSHRSLVRGGGFYPSEARNARERLAYYATRLPLAEAATTYRFPPTPELSRRWADALPAGFTLDLRAWSLLSGAPTWPESVWPDLQVHIRPSRREGTKLYRSRLPAEVVEECWARFRHAIFPLATAGVLGTVIFRYPSWFSPRPAALEELATLPSRMAGFKVAVELASRRWYDDHGCERTFAMLEELGLAFVCRDEPAGTRPVVAATHDVALVRFLGRVEGPGSWGYRYSREELSAWVPLVRDLASGTKEVHLIMDNSWQTDAVDNAAILLELLA